MRGSTAAGINNSLLPRDAAAGNLLVGICWWCRLGKGLFSLVFVGFPVVLSVEETFSLAFVWISGSIVWGRGLFFLVFVGFPVALYRKSPFSPGVCWISGSAVWGRDLFPGICGEFVGGAILEEAFFPWYLWHSAFVAFGVFGIRLIRYRRGPPVVRNMRAVRKTGSYGTRRVFKGIRCKKQAFLVRE